MASRTAFHGSLRKSGRLRVSRCWFKDRGTAFPKEIPHAPIISAAAGCGFLAGSCGAQYPNILLNEMVFPSFRRHANYRRSSHPNLYTWIGKQLGKRPAAAGYPTSQPSSACFQASRFTSAMDSVRGMPLGQACTQFCALAHSWMPPGPMSRSEEHTSELQSRRDLVCRLLLEKKKNK